MKIHSLLIAAILLLASVPAVAAGAAGAEPGKVYRAYNAALIKGDFDAMQQLMSKTSAARLSSQRDDPQFKMLFAFVQESAVHDPKIGSAQVDGDKATLEVSGKDAGGADTTSTASLVREGGVWKFESESIKSAMH